MAHAQKPREIELKCDVAAADLPRLRERLTLVLAGAGDRQRLASVYYDTPALELLDRDVTLRVRTGGDRIVQTVKRARGRGAALFDRDEWETGLVSPDPDLAAFAATPAAAGLDRPVSLQPVFETRVERTIWQVEHGASRIEVALDEGQVVAGRASAPIAELEVELKRGEAADLFDLIRLVDAVGLLRPSVLSKSERGYRLRRGHAGASKAEPVRLDKGMTAADAFRAIMANGLRQFGLNAPLVVAERAPKALHQARVALRRLRSAMSLFRPLVEDRDYPALAGDLRTLSQVLGRARDLDVYLARARDGGTAATGSGREAPAHAADLERCRAAAYDEAVERLQAPACAVLLMRLAQWSVAGPWLLDRGARGRKARDVPVRTAASRILDKRAGRLRRRGRRLADLDPSARHRVRIAAKKLRYAAEFFAGLVRKPKAERRLHGFLDAVAELQDHLGALNDRETARALVADLDGALPDASGPVPRPAAGAAEPDAEAETLLWAAETAHRRFVEAGRFWSRWRA